MHPSISVSLFFTLYIYANVINVLVQHSLHTPDASTKANSDIYTRNVGCLVGNEIRPKNQHSQLEGNLKPNLESNDYNDYNVGIRWS